MLKILYCKKSLWESEREQKASERDRMASTGFGSAPSVRFDYSHAWPICRVHKYSLFYFHIMVYKYKLDILYLLPGCRAPNQNYSLFSVFVFVNSFEATKWKTGSSRPSPIFYLFLLLKREIFVLQFMHFGSYAENWHPRRLIEALGLGWRFFFYLYVNMLCMQINN